MNSRERSRSAAPIGVGVPRRILKARKALAEADVKKVVRSLCVERDGYCKFAEVLPDCEGPSEWAHLEDKKRARTRNMEPTERHTTEKSLMACTKHHREYDAGRIKIAI